MTLKLICWSISTLYLISLFVGLGDCRGQGQELEGEHLRRGHGQSETWRRRKRDVPDYSEYFVEVEAPDFDTKPKARTAAKDPDFPESYPTRIILNNNTLRKITNEETLRIIQLSNAQALYNDPGPGPNPYPSEWGILQRVKTIFLTHCPTTDVTPFLVNGMIRLFRYILTISNDENPSGMWYKDVTQSVRIRDSLQKCLAEGQAMNFTYDYKNDCVNTTDNQNQTQSTCTCESFVNSVKISSNATVNLTKDSIPGVIKFRVSDQPSGGGLDVGSNDGVDFPIEASWKMISFVHYHCSSYFGENPHDHSALLFRLNRLFTDRVKQRWLHPGNSFQAYQVIFSRSNLKKFASDLDTCVAAAKEVSNYSKWIVRPFFDGSENSTDIQGVTKEVE